MAKVESTGANKVKIEVTVSPEDFNDALQKAYFKSRGKFTVQGFRKGKAPRPVIENYYGEGIFYEDAFELVFPQSYTNKVDELELVPVSRPELDIKTISKNEGVVYTAEFFTKPEVKLGEYKEVKAQEVKADVDEKQVEAELQKLAERNARWVDIDREARDKDKVVIDYSGSIDGEKFEGGTAENQALEIGSGMFIPGFEEQIIGMKKDEEKDITVDFPADYRAEHLAGKKAVFHIKLHDVKIKEMPELNDEFAQDVSEFDTLEEYRADILKKLAEKAEEQAKTQTQSNVLKEVVNNAKIDLPDCMTENQIDNQIKQIEYSLMYQGMKLDDYLKMTGGTMEELRENYRQPAENAVRTQLVIEAVMKAEGIEASGEQLDEELKKRAETAKKDFEEYKKAVGEEELEYIKNDLAYDNTVNFLVDNAVLTAEKKAKSDKKDKKDKTEKEKTEDK